MDKNQLVGKSRFLSVFITTLGAAVVSSLANAATPAPALQKYDAQLMPLMSAKGLSKLELYDRAFVETAADGITPTVRTLVRFTGDGVASIKALGARVTSISGDVAAVEVPLSNLKAMTALSDVVYVEAVKFIPQRLNASVPATKAPQLRTGTSPNLGGFTGKGVIVGIVDDGLDFTHQDFRKTDGTSRLLALWDQRESGASGPVPSGFTYGGECDTASLSKARGAVGACAQPSTGNHGTHVGGIAAGNGQQTGNGKPAYRYVGMAPEADILAANSIGGGVNASDAVVDAITWMKAKAAAANKPLAINLSLGSYFGARDGTSNFERAMSNAGGPGVIIAAAAGNEGGDKIRALGTISAGETKAVNFTWAPTVTRSQRLEMWYPGSNKYSVRITGPNCDTGEFLAAGEFKSYSLACGRLDITSGGINATNDDRQIFVSLNVPTNQAASVGSWTISIRGDEVSAANTPFSMICAEDSNGLVFTTNIDYTETPGILTDTSTATRNISVGSYNTNYSWETAAGPFTQNPSHGPLTDLSNFSSRGPRRDCSNLSKCPPIMKPEIAAPGAMIMAALGFDAKKPDNPDTVEADGTRVAYNGTSMATPHVTGAIALMLQKDPKLTPEKVKELLFKNVQTNSFTTSLPTFNAATPDVPAAPNYRWGYGILDAKAAVDAIALAGVTVSAKADPLNANPGTAAGRDLVYTLTITNNTTTAVAGESALVITLPTNSPLIWVTTGCTSTATTVNCTIPALGVGATAVRNVVVRPSAAGEKTLTATVTPAGGPTSPIASVNTSVFASAAAQKIDRYRLYRANNNSHYYTLSLSEYNALAADSAVWKGDKVSMRIHDNPVTIDGVAALPYYKIIIPSQNRSIWTNDANEYYVLTILQSVSYTGAGADGYVFLNQVTGTQPLFRIHNDAIRRHLWTSDANEANYLVNVIKVYVYEGNIGFPPGVTAYVFPPNP